MACRSVAEDQAACASEDPAGEPKKASAKDEDSSHHKRDFDAPRDGEHPQDEMQHDNGVVVQEIHAKTGICQVVKSCVQLRPTAPKNGQEDTAKQEFLHHIEVRKPGLSGEHGGRIDAATIFEIADFEEDNKSHESQKRG